MLQDTDESVRSQKLWHAWEVLVLSERINPEKHTIQKDNSAGKQAQAHSIMENRKECRPQPCKAHCKASKEVRASELPGDQP